MAKAQYDKCVQNIQRAQHSSGSKTAINTKTGLQGMFLYFQLNIYVQKPGVPQWFFSTLCLCVTSCFDTYQEERQGSAETSE